MYKNLYINDSEIINSLRYNDFIILIMCNYIVISIILNLFQINENSISIHLLKT